MVCPCIQCVLLLASSVAASRIEKRVCRCVAPVSPSAFQLPPAPFSLLNSEVLLSKDALLPSIISDTDFIAQQARFVKQSSCTCTLYTVNASILANDKYCTP